MQTQLYTSFVYFMCKLMGKRIAYHYIFNYECAKNSFFPFIFTSKEFINAIMTFFSKIIEEKSQNSCTAIDSKLTNHAPANHKLVNRNIFTECLCVFIY